VTNAILADEAFRLRYGDHDAQAIAESLVGGEVAPDAAVGWAARTRSGWVREVAAASRHGRIEADPLFDLASVTKPMTAVAVAWGRHLPPQWPLGEVLPEAKNTPSERASVELLLSHRAGLRAHVALFEAALAGPEAGLDASSALRRAAEARREDALGPLPPEGFLPVYSDLGFVLVGEALARAERARDAGEVIEHRLARALGREDLGTARHLALRHGVRFRERVRPTEVVPWRGGEIRGMVHDDNAWALTKDGGSGHAGMFGTADAVLDFGCAVLDVLERGEGPFRGADLRWLVQPRHGGTLLAGFDQKSQVGSSVGSVAGPRTFGHLGFTGTSLWIDPDAGAVVTVLTNRVSPTRESTRIRAARPVAHDALFTLAARRRLERIK
jgi:CubicO group peptidase (beta-lactamase class C family)